MKHATTSAWRSGALVCSLLTGVLFAGPARGQSNSFSTVVSMPSLNCSTAAGTGTFSVLSWSIGAQNSGITPGRTGRDVSSTLGPLQFVKALDACTPILFGRVVTGTLVPSVTLTESSGGIPLVTVKLTGVIVSSDQVSGSGGAPPSEAVSLTYTRISITNNPSGTTFCWDVSTLSPCSGS